MLGRNHAVYAAAGWTAAWPHLGWTGADLSDPALLAVTAGIAAGAGVVPDLDHPDSRATRHFGLLSRVVAKGLESASGGHRWGTHSLLFAVLLAAATYSSRWLPYSIGLWAAVLCCSFCCSVGAALIGPSLGFRMPWPVSAAALICPGWYVWAHYDRVAPVLWLIAAGGVVVHVVCDAVTKGGVPVLWPFTRARFKLGLFRVGGAGERVAGIAGIAALAWAAWTAASRLRWQWPTVDGLVFW